MAPGGRMVGGQDEMDRVAVEVLAVDARRARARLVLPLVGQHEVDVPERQRGQRLLGLGLDELAAQAGRRAGERLHRRRRDADRHRLEGGDARQPGDAAGGCGELGLGELGALEQDLGVADEDDRGVGQAHAAACPLQQRHARLALEHRELLGDGRGRELQRVGHGGDRAALVQLVQQAEAAEVEHRVSNATDYALGIGVASARSVVHDPVHALPRRAPLPRLRRRLRRHGDLRQARLRRRARPSGRCWPRGSCSPPRCCGGSRPARAASAACARSRAATSRSPWRSARSATAPRPASYFAALDRLDASLFSLLLYTFPAIVAVAAVVLGRERASRRTAIALLLASAGIVLVLAGAASGALDPLGTALGLTAARRSTAPTSSAPRASPRGSARWR